MGGDHAMTQSSVPTTSESAQDVSSNLSSPVTSSCVVVGVHGLTKTNTDAPYSIPHSLPGHPIHQFGDSTPTDSTTVAKLAGRQHSTPGMASPGVGPRPDLTIRCGCGKRFSGYRRILQHQRYTLKRAYFFNRCRQGPVTKNGEPWPLAASLPSAQPNPTQAPVQDRPSKEPVALQTEPTSSEQPDTDSRIHTVHLRPLWSNTHGG